MRLLKAIRRQVVIARISGIPVRADFRWFFVILLMSAITAAGIGEYAGSLAASLSMGLASTLVFFVSIFLHEYAHAAAARMEGLEVVEIIIHPFGGLTRFRRVPDTPRAEFRVAIAGPAASFLLAILFVAAAVAASAAAADVLAILMFTLAIGNFLIAVFNLLPGYPLDGGRVLRAYLWHSGKDLDQATILTGRWGQIIAGGMVLFGLLIAAIKQDFFIGFWAMLVGIFLYDSASAIIKEVNEIKQISVDDVMAAPAALSPELGIQDFIDHILPISRQAIFPVAANRQFYGIFTLRTLEEKSRDEWRTLFIRDVMQPIADDHFVKTGSPLSAAREVMKTNGLGAVGVIDSAGLLVGFISLQIAEGK
ncbi:MAG TPA: hypothetical protein DEA22_03350 [Blastocatellia bacterium]|nr:hypothetical protein [Blastocatellia bacterium]